MFDPHKHSEMKTTNTKIADFQIGDRMTYYNAIFEITSDCKQWQNHKGNEDTAWTYGRNCKFVSYNDGSGKKGDGLLEGYDYMQGTEVVTYAKIVELTKGTAVGMWTGSEHIDGVTIEEVSGVVDSTKRVVRVRWEDKTESIENVNNLY